MPSAARDLLLSSFQQRLDAYGQNSTHSRFEDVAARCMRPMVPLQSVPSASLPMRQSDAAGQCNGTQRPQAKEWGQFGRLPCHSEGSSIEKLPPRCFEGE